MNLDLVQFTQPARQKEKGGCSSRAVHAVSRCFSLRRLNHQIAGGEEKKKQDGRYNRICITYAFDLLTSMASILRARTPFYRGVLAARTNLVRAPARKFTTSTESSSPPPPSPPKSSSGLYIGLGVGAAALIGGALYVSSTDEDASAIAKSATKVPSNFKPTVADYQKVRCHPVTSLTPVRSFILPFSGV